MTGISKKNSVVHFLLKHKDCDPVSFHMPGHKGNQLYERFGYDEFLQHMVDCDITEICGADNLFQAEDIIAETMERYRQLYDVRKSYLLVNGSSCGLISAIMASVNAGKKLIMARNCHKSTFNALTLGNISPAYIYPRLIEEFGISGEIDPDDVRKALEEEPEAEAVIIPSPNYYGICSDVKAIADIVHEYGKLLIVDQAHGAHLKFFGDVLEDRDLPYAAEECGADIVINSIHKTLGSFTQSALMNVTSDRVDLAYLEDKLQAVESTSPSYLLMASLDINAEILEEHEDELIRGWYDNLKRFYEEAKNIKGLKIVNTGSNMDWTKINLDMSGCGLSGYELEDLLLEKDIFIELVTGNIVMCMTGIGNRPSDFDRLLVALKEISEKYDKQSANFVAECNENLGSHVQCIDGKIVYETIEEEEDVLVKFAKLTAEKAELTSLPIRKEYVPIEESVGRVCASSIIPYPPGIPLICPGEIISKGAMEYAFALRKSGEKVMGITEDYRVLVGRDYI